jgi:hypothetical protein
MASIQFTTRVLGNEATQRLRDFKVRQTIRSNKHTIPLKNERNVSITLDNVLLYNAKIESISRTTTRELTQLDAEAGGFSALEDLHLALIRAGFRFKANYDVYKIKFIPIQ